MNMNISRSHLFIVSGILALIFTFFIDVVTGIGILNEFKIIFHVKWKDIPYWKWYEYAYITSYYLLRFGVIVALLRLLHSRKLILFVLILLLINIISSIWFFQNDYHPVWVTYIPYLSSIITWLYLGLTRHKEQS